MTHIRIGLLGQMPTAKTQDDQIQKLSFPKSAATSADIMAWEKAGYKPSLKDFMKNRKAKTNG